MARRESHLAIACSRLQSPVCGPEEDYRSIRDPSARNRNGSRGHKMLLDRPWRSMPCTSCSSSALAVMTAITVERLFYGPAHARGGMLTDTGYRAKVTDFSFDHRLHTSEACE